MFVLLTVFLENRISSMANMFVYKPVRDGILAVHTVRYPAVRIVVDYRRPWSHLFQNLFLFVMARSRDF